MLPDSGREQTTLARSFSISGTSLHTGVAARVCVEPAPAGAGIVFECPSGSVRAELAAVCEAARCTAIESGSSRVETIEHAMAALYGLGVDNVLVRMEEGTEFPCMDGSAAPFAEAVLAAEVTPIPGSRRGVRTVPGPLCIQNGDAMGMVLPHVGLRATVLVDFPEPVGREIVDVADVRSEFMERVAAARTPGFVREWDALKANGLALGARADNVLPILDDGYGDELRVPNEVGAHKLLDLVGDLGLVGEDISAHIITIRGGHALNHAIGRAILNASADAP